MNTKEQVLKALKEAGYNNSMVTVSYKHSTITATIRNPKVSYAEVSRIMDNFESISRCQYSGEILLGGNTYTEVMVSDKVKEIWCKDYVEEVIDAMKENPTIGMGISLPSCFILWHDTENNYTISKNNSQFRCWTNKHPQTIKSAALDMYIYDQMEEAKKSRYWVQPSTDIISGSQAPSCDFVMSNPNS